MLIADYKFLLTFLISDVHVLVDCARVSALTSDQPCTVVPVQLHSTTSVGTSTVVLVVLVHFTVALLFIV